MKGELLALVKNMEQWKHILKYWPPFLVYTDASSLNYIVRHCIYLFRNFPCSPRFIKMYQSRYNLSAIKVNQDSTTTGRILGI